MKLLCISDATDTLIYSSIAPELYRDVDFVISAGDLPLRYYDYIQTMLRKDVYYVYGNHNLEDFGRMMKGSSDSFIYAGGHDAHDMPIFGGHFLDGKCIYDKRRNLIIAGLGGSMLYNYGDSQYSEKQMQWRINKLVPRLIYNKKRFGRALDILVKKTVEAAKEKGVSTVTAGGGVIANGYLRENLSRACEEAGLRLVLPVRKHCTDNAAMIAAEGLVQYRAGNFSPLSLNARASIPLR